MNVGRIIVANGLVVDFNKETKGSEINQTRWSKMEMGEWGRLKRQGGQVENMGRGVQ